MKRFIKRAAVLIALLCAYAILETNWHRHQLNRERALARATELMSNVCARQCAQHGVSLAGFGAAEEAKVNFAPGSKEFEFSWRQGHVTLKVVVYDNGMFVDSEYWWRDQ